MDTSFRIDELLDLVHGPAVGRTDVVGDIVHLIAIILGLVVIDSTIGVSLCHNRLTGVALGSSGPFHLKELIAGVDSGEPGLDLRGTIGSEGVPHVFNGDRVAAVVGIKEKLRVISFSPVGLSSRGLIAQGFHHLSLKGHILGRPNTVSQGYEALKGRWR